MHIAYFRDNVATVYVVAERRTKSSCQTSLECSSRYLMYNVFYNEAIGESWMESSKQLQVKI